MASKKFVAISYCFAFLFVYFSSIAYALLSESINKSFEVELPQTAAMNSTVTAISSFSSWSGMVIIIGIVALVLAIIFFIICSRLMGAAI